MRRRHRRVIWRDPGAIKIVPDEPPHSGFGQQVTLGIFCHRWRREGQVNRRVDQQLMHQTVGLLQGDECGKVATGGVTTDGDTVRIHPDLPTVFQHPLGNRHTVDHRGRSRVLGREPIIHADHIAHRTSGEIATDRIMRVERPNHPASTVKEQQHRGTTRGGMPIVPTGHTVDVEVAHLGNITAGTSHLLHQRKSQPGIFRGALFHWRMASLGHHREKASSSRIKCHR